MACNCGNSTTSGSSPAILTPAPDPSAQTTPDGKVVGSDVSKGGTVPGYASPGGGGGSVGSGGGYTSNGSQHSTGGHYDPGTPKAVPPGLGGLSQRYESGGKGPGAIGNDKVGGYSYGTYQIATNTGTMNNYMAYLEKNNPEQFATLQAAGGATAAKAGDPAFQQAWQNMAANDPAFAASQSSFIQSSHYDPAVNNIQNATGLDITQRSIGVQNAVWSTSVQNGPNSAVFTNAFAGKDTANMTDSDIVNAIYDERGKTNPDGTLKYFSSSTPAVQASVANRFVSERQGALTQVNSVPQLATSAVAVNAQVGI